MLKKIVFCLFLAVGLLSCAAPPSPLKAVLLTSDVLLADMVRNITGPDFLTASVVPNGMDLHAFSPAPTDLKKIVDAQVLVVHGLGLESWLDKVIAHSGSQAKIVEASEGLVATLRGGDDHEEDDHEEEKGDPDDHDEDEDDHAEGDPHFWMDPTLVAKYVLNIERALSEWNPESKESFAKNAGVYISRLNELDMKIKQLVSTLPLSRRKLVTDHESLGYFADRYGFEVVGSVIPSFSTDSAPSAQDVSRLISTIKDLEIKAIFTEVGFNQSLVQQISRETGAKVVENLSSHSLSDAEGLTPTYIDMVWVLSKTIVESLSTN